MERSSLLEPEHPLGDDIDPGTLRFARGPKGLRLFIGAERCYLEVRVLLADPLGFPDRYISVVDRRGREICLLDTLDGLDRASRDVVEAELSRCYTIPRIGRVLDLSIKHGPLYWLVETDRGRRDFVVKWSSENVLPLPDGRLRLTDVHGNRFEVPPLDQLDPESRRRVALLG